MTQDIETYYRSLNDEALEDAIIDLMQYKPDPFKDIEVSREWLAKLKAAKNESEERELEMPRYMKLFEQESINEAKEASNQLRKYAVGLILAGIIVGGLGVGLSAASGGTRLYIIAVIAGAVKFVIGLVLLIIWSRYRIKYRKYLGS